jgi:hypothetical protein
MSGQHHILRKKFPLPIQLEAGWAPEPVWTQWLRKQNPIIFLAEHRTPVFQSLISILRYLSSDERLQEY